VYFSPYFIWLNENREMIKNLLPQEERNKIGNVSKKAGQLWSSLTEEEKYEWNEKAQKQKETILAF
jgi:hypothetical protein